MKFLGLNIETKKELRARLAIVENQLIYKTEQYEDLVERYNKVCSDLQYMEEDIKTQLDEMNETFPFYLGQVVYDVQLRSASGRYTKTKASREHSLVNEVIVDKKNYFNLVDRYNNYDVFMDRDAAEKHLDNHCVD